MTEKFKSGRSARRLNQIIDDVSIEKTKPTYPDHRAKSGHWIYRATCTDAAGSGSTIACSLPNFVDDITVTCDIVGGSALNAAIPRLAIGSVIMVWNNAGTWRSIMTFQATEDCE